MGYGLAWLGLAWILFGKKGGDVCFFFWVYYLCLEERARCCGWRLVGRGGLGWCDKGFSTWDGMMVWIWKGGETFLTLVL